MWLEETNEMVDEILEKMQIRVYQYRQANGGESPLIVISDKLYENLICPSVELREVTVKRNVNSTLIGCRFMVFDGLEENEFIVGQGFKVVVKKYE